MTTTLTPTAAPSRPVLGLGGRWARFALRRTGRLVVSLWALVTASFLMIHFVPGDPVRAALGLTAPPELVAARRASLGLDDPLLTQYLNYLVNLFHGDLGESIQTEIPVWDTIAQRLPATASLAVLAFVAAVVISIPLGVVVAVATRRGRRRRTELASPEAVSSSGPSPTSCSGSLWWPSSRSTSGGSRSPVATARRRTSSLSSP
jgi:peptide/nickel transport system permease protein